LEAQKGAAGVEGEAPSNVKEAVAQSFWFAAGELAGEQQALCPGDQVVREQHDL
jgi:hypothetical protein